MEVQGGLRLYLDCVNVGLTLATEEAERCTNSSRYTGTPAYSRLENVERILEKEGTLRSATMVPFIDWRNKVENYNKMQKNRDLERMGSRTSSLFRQCDGSNREDLKSFDQHQRNLLSLHYRGVVPQPSGRCRTQVYENQQRVWLGTFTQEQELHSCNVQRQEAITNFKPVEESNPETLFLSGHPIGELFKNATPSSNAHRVSGVDAVQPDDNEEKGSGQASEKSECPKKETFSREHMFDKAVTPSDVGKLNRLVIPKQHAEKYFPLDTNANEKGLLLNFEDNTGKTWRFRYSYWNSSQSYVLTKGWSRFVKEKKLDSGDIVSFERGTDAQTVERLFISWRRRPCSLPPSKATLLPGLSLSSFPSFEYGSFQSHGLNIRAGGGELGKGQHVKAFPEWMSAMWSPNNSGASSHPAPMWAGKMDSRQLHPINMAMRIDTEKGQNSGREALDFMQLKAAPGERSWHIENAAVKSSKKGVRLFGVNL